MRLARWVLTVLMLMYRSSPISLLVRPWATGIRTSSSRLVRGSMGWVGGGPAWDSEKAARSRAVMLGAIRASPSAAAWTACVSSAGPASLSEIESASARPDGRVGQRQQCPGSGDGTVWNWMILSRFSVADSALGAVAGPAVRVVSPRASVVT